jgi:hypothetical protein
VCCAQDEVYGAVGGFGINDLEVQRDAALEFE